MSDFILLHGANEEESGILIKKDSIECVLDNCEDWSHADKYTRVDTEHEAYCVKETAEEIYKMMEDNYGN